MPPIWIIEESLDGGKTWRISQPYHLYKRKATADKAVEGYDGWRWKYRITEYRAVEGEE